MKVGILVPGGLDPSGTHRVIPALLWLIERLARQAEVHAFAFSPAPRTHEYTLYGARVHAAGRGIRPARVAAAVLAEHARGRFDVLHAFWATRCGTVAVPVGRSLGVPVVVHLAGGETASLPEIGYGDARTRRGRRIVRAVLRGATVVTAPSRSVVQRAGEFGVQALRIPLGVDRTAWPPCPPRQRDTARPARLVHVASLNAVKDPFTLLAALGRLVKRDVAFTLDVIGEDVLHGLAENAVQRHGLADHARFHGFRTQHELRPHVLGSDLMVMASRHEAGPIAVLEAAMSGVPTVGTAVGHLEEWAPDAAVTVPPGDADALADAVAMMLSNEPRRLEVARAAHERALAEDADATASAVLALYESITRSTKSR